MKIKLRKIVEKDLAMIMNWRMEKEVTRYMFTDPVLTYDMQKKWFKDIYKKCNDYYWIIQYDETDIGVLSLNNIDLEKRECSLGYYIARLDFRGRGITRNIILNIYTFVFDSLKLNKIISEVLETNQRAIYIYERFGFEVKKKFKDCIYKNGKKINVIHMTILKNQAKKIIEEYKHEKICIEV